MKAHPIPGQGSRVAGVSIDVGRQAAAVAEWPAGFLGLYHREYGRMVRLARLMTGTNAVAEDLVQDTFVRVARRWDRVRDPSAYLRQAVVNACRSHLRKRGRFRPLESAPEPSVPGPSPQVDRTWRQMERLSPRRRAALVLRYYEDLDDDEIAEILDCKPATVRSLVHRALRQLEEALS